jgi:hypothetical protein
MVTRILLMLVCVGVLSTVTGCYEEPSPYAVRPTYTYCLPLSQSR